MASQCTKGLLEDSGTGCARTGQIHVFSEKTEKKNTTCAKRLVSHLLKEIVVHPNPMIEQALEIGLLPFMNEMITKSVFFSKVHPPVYVIMHAVALGKKHYRSCTVNSMELTTEGKYHLQLLHEQTHDKRGLQNHCCACIGLIACEVGVFVF